MATSKNKLKIISLSDVHLGHNRTETEDTIRGLREMLFGSDFLQDADVLIIGGDWTHGLLSFSDNVTGKIYSFMATLMDWCGRRKIKLRVLKGTPSHDWEQSKWFERLNQNNRCDLKYIDTVYIDRMEDLGIDVLYVPDEWKEGPEDAWKDVQKCMAELGIDKVDISVVHGTFDHHLPEFVKTHKHSGKDYSDITRHYVLIGHIHTHSIKGKLLTNGSFDRTAHSEEEPKGFLYLEINKKGKDSIVFVENRFATIYKTIYCIGMEDEAAIRHIEKELVGIKKGHIRLRVSEDSRLNDSYSEIKELYPNLSWKKEIFVSESAKKEMQENIKTKLKLAESITVNKDNVFELFEKELDDLSQDDREKVKSKFAEIVKYVGN